MRIFLSLEKWEKQFPNWVSYIPMAFLNTCAMINFEKRSNFLCVSLYAEQMSLSGRVKSWVLDESGQLECKPW